MNVDAVYFEIAVGAGLGIIAIFPFARKGGEFLQKYFALTLIAAALIYAAFAVVGTVAGTASLRWLLTEVSGVLIFSIPALLGYKGRPWLLSLAWLLHLFWDTGLHGGPSTSFVPGFYPGLCVGFDLVFAAFIAYYFYFRDRG
ncbi:MAG: hypothetical protein DWQ47_00410 [Acidobacteria bacterium]|nr:MAG: hypothetical protein DWQ32_10870 [Acidobacteriota bacterium]REK03972.1 MAG: hypothetical protein DWQ38_00395 [Acidobacteriota bacterium]REK15134.1 MAG: hypothetical protein DWQ43_16560 [Acidobacteriota bacterium]REK46224.1 MAG: hypothetical protein DWQ47_00410 [Acidobacteriota bacterium]